MNPKTGDTVRVQFTATVERYGDAEPGRRYVYAGGLWLAPDQYEVIEEDS